MKHLLINIPRKIYIIKHNEQTLGNTDRAILLPSEHLSESYNQENEAEFCGVYSLCTIRRKIHLEVLLAVWLWIPFIPFSLPFYVFHSGHILLFTYDKFYTVGLVTFFSPSCFGKLWDCAFMYAHVYTRGGGTGVRHKAEITLAACITPVYMGGCLITYSGWVSSSPTGYSLHLPREPMNGIAVLLTFLYGRLVIRSDPLCQSWVVTPLCLWGPPGLN